MRVTLKEQTLYVVGRDSNADVVEYGTVSVQDGVVVVDVEDPGVKALLERPHSYKGKKLGPKDGQEYLDALPYIFQGDRLWVTLSQSS